jgi:hypothetical protein
MRLAETGSGKAPGDRHARDADRHGPGARRAGRARAGERVAVTRPLDSAPALMSSAYPFGAADETEHVSSPVVPGTAVT